MKGNIRSKAILQAASGTSNAAQINITDIMWYVTQCTPSVALQILLRKQKTCRAPPQSSYIERSVGVKPVHVHLFSKKLLFVF